MTPRGVRKLAVPEPFKIIMSGGQFDIIVEDSSARPGYVTMRRWVPAVGSTKGQWRTKALGRFDLRDERGAVLSAAIANAKDQAMIWYRQLTGAEPTPPDGDAAENTITTVGATWSFLSNPETGRYPHSTPFRSELQRALEYATVVWGRERRWDSVTVGDWRTLIRRRVSALVKNERTGIRATEITVSRLITAIRALQSEKQIVPGAAAIHPDWRDELVTFWKGLTGETNDPEPHQPRYSLEESQKLIAASEHADPRMALLVYLGAELRLGQVGRAKRSQVDRAARSFEIRGAGDKKGTTIDLLDADVVALDRAFAGHLRALEEKYLATAADYFLFPGGQLADKKSDKRIVSPRDPRSAGPWSREARQRWWRAVEVLAGVEHIDGRGPYGIRRAAVDAALDENISEQGLQNLGGWSTGDVPRRIYAEKTNKSGRRDAKPIRSKLRRGAE